MTVSVRRSACKFAVILPEHVEVGIKGTIALSIACLQVWRILFWAMAGISVLTCVLILTMAVEPRSINNQVNS